MVSPLKICCEFISKVGFTEMRCLQDSSRLSYAYPMTEPLRFIDLFCGIGGFRVATESVCKEKRIKATCVFSSDIDPDARTVYTANFGEEPTGDITQIDASIIPDHDILFAGFPCQAFSIIGDRKGFDDTRGTLFFDIARILAEKKPKAFVLENVKQLVSHDRGKTLSIILGTLHDLGYHTEYRILNALDFGLPHKRERIFIVGFQEPLHFNWPTGNVPMKPLKEMLEPTVDDFYYASAQIRENRQKSREGKKTFNELTIWHENKGGNIGVHPFSCALRAGASYNYLLVNGERRLTEREMLRLQGFPESFKINVGYGAMRKLVGNSVAVPVVTALVKQVVETLEEATIASSFVVSSDSNGVPAYTL
jgi:DNA (cytosine-5)-methyltransferase 1